MNLSTKQSNESLISEYNKTKSLRIKDTIIRNNQGMVHEIIAKKFDYQYIKEDLFQEGLIALNSAIDNYNPDKKIQFSTYAYIIIRNKLINYMRSENRQMKTESLDESCKTAYPPISVESFLEMSKSVYKDTSSKFLEGIMSNKLNNKQKRAFKKMYKHIKKDLY